MTRVLVTGASGLLGRAIMKELSANPSLRVLGIAYSRCKGTLRKVDITDPNQIAQIVEEFKPEVIVHAAAERRPDIVEKDEAQTYKLNVTATKTLCQKALEANAYVLYISTDYVFDGKNPPYEVDAHPSPLNKYGLSKLEGEKVTMETNDRNIVFRIPILYGPLEYLSESAVTIWFPKVKECSKECLMNNTQHRFPTYTPDIADAINKLIIKRSEDHSLSGYFHFSGLEDITRYHMCLIMGEVSGLSTSHIKADNSPPTGATRPDNSFLNSRKLEAVINCKRTPFQMAVKECLQPFL